MSFESVSKSKTSERETPRWKKVAASTAAGLALVSFAGCSEKVSAEGSPTTPSASAPKTPEVFATKTPGKSAEAKQTTPTEKPIVLSKAIQEYSAGITPDKLQGQSDLHNILAMSNTLPDPEKDPEEYGQAMFAALNATAQVCNTAIERLDDEGAPRNANDMFSECVSPLRNYFRALYPGADTEETSSATMIKRMLDRSSLQTYDIKNNFGPKGVSKYSFDLVLTNVTTSKDGTITIRGYGQDFGLDPRSKNLIDYTNSTTASIGDTTSKRSAPTRDNFTVSYNPKNGSYEDSIPSCVDSSTSACK